LLDFFILNLLYLINKLIFVKTFNNMSNNKTNFVTLDLDKYEELTEFKRNIMGGKIVQTIYTNYHQINYHTSDEIIKDLTEKYNLLNKDYIDKLNECNTEKRERNKLQQEIDRITTIKINYINPLPSVDEFKNMSIWDFIKWKFNNK